MARTTRKSKLSGGTRRAAPTARPQAAGQAGGQRGDRGHRGGLFNPAIFEWRTLTHALLAMTWLVLIAAAILGWRASESRLMAYAALPAVALDGTVRGPVDVAFRNLPAWLHGETLHSLTRAVQHSMGEDPLDRNDLVRAHQALMSSGWFDSVVQVRRAAADRVEVTGVFVEPAALIRFDDRDHLLDDQGRLLPQSWPAGTAPALGVILSPGFGPPEAPGVRWRGPDILAALAVLELIDSQPWATQVQAVDLGDFSRSRSIRLITDRGSIIRWGRAPGDERGAEVTSRSKLEFLTLHQQKYGHIDGGLTGEVDISGDVAVVR